MAEAFSIILYVLGSILLVVLIILVVKLIGTINKVNLVLDDATKKLKTLDGFFSVIDFTTDKLALVNSKIVDFFTSLVKKIFNKRKDEFEEDE